MKLRLIAVVGLSSMILAAAGLAATSSASADTPSLTVTATFDKASYVSGEDVSVTLSVKNTGSTAATGITVQTDSTSTELAVLGLDAFGPFTNGTTIAAGHTVTTTVAGNIGNLTASEVTFSGNVFDQEGGGVADFSISAPVTVQNATVSGEVFGDANSNGVADPGEGVSGAALHFSYFYGDNTYAVTTGAGGMFSISLPTAKYSIDGSGGGWTVIPKIFTLPTGGATLSLRAVKPLGQVLKAAIHFAKDTYAPGDTVHLVVTLTNTGADPLFGIGAECDHVGNADELMNNNPGWGDLAFDGPGVALAAHQTRTFDVTDTVPAGAQAAGQVAVECDFGYPEIDEGARPSAFDTAKVPGLSGAFDGEVDYFPHGHGGASVGLAGVRVVLVDSTTCPVFTRTTTSDSHGRFHFASAPAGQSYKLYLYPPAGWKVVGDNPNRAFIFGDDTVHFFFEVEHGSAPVPTAPTTCGGTSSTPPPLADTGVDAAELSTVGGAALLVGLLLMLSTRRRREDS